MLKSFLFPRSVPCFFLIFLFFMQNGIMKELGKMFNRNFVDGWYSSSSSGEPASVGYNPTRTLVMYLSLFLFYSILDICFSKYNSRMDTFQFRTCCKWCRHQMVFWIGHRLIGRAIQVGNDAIIRSCMSFNYHAPVTSWIMMDLSQTWWNDCVDRIPNLIIMHNGTWRELLKYFCCCSIFAIWRINEAAQSKLTELL